MVEQIKNSKTQKLKNKDWKDSKVENVGRLEKTKTQKLKSSKILKFKDSKIQKFKDSKIERFKN